MADQERLQAFARYVEQFPSSQAGDFTGKLIQVRFVGEAPHVRHQCILVDYDAVGVHVKEATGGAPSDTQFYLWHTIARIGH